MKTPVHRINQTPWMAMAAVTVVALAVTLSAGCASSKGKGEVAKEIRNLPNGLVADTEKSNHTDQTLEDGDNAGSGE